MLQARDLNAMPRTGLEELKKLPGGSGATKRSAANANLAAETQTKPSGPTLLELADKAQKAGTQEEREKQEEKLATQVLAMFMAGSKSDGANVTRFNISKPNWDFLNNSIVFAMATVSNYACLEWQNKVLSNITENTNLDGTIFGQHKQLAQRGFQTDLQEASDFLRILVCDTVPFMKDMSHVIKSEIDGHPQKMRASQKMNLEEAEGAEKAVRQILTYEMARKTLVISDDLFFTGTGNNVQVTAKYKCTPVCVVLGYDAKDDAVRAVRASFPMAKIYVTPEPV